MVVIRSSETSVDFTGLHGFIPHKKVLFNIIRVLAKIRSGHIESTGENMAA
jgi:hypothetical protein